MSFKNFHLQFLYSVWFLVIVKATNGPRYVVGCRRQLDKTKLKAGTRVALDMTTLTIMRYLPREVDPLVYNMSHEDPGDVTYSAIGGLSEQIRELREVIELPLLNPELFMRVGITPPKGMSVFMNLSYIAINVDKSLLTISFVVAFYTVGILVFIK